MFAHIVLFTMKRRPLYLLCEVQGHEDESDTFKHLSNYCQCWSHWIQRSSKILNKNGN